MAPAKCRTQPPVTVTLVITLKDISNGNPSISVFVRSSKPVGLIKIRTACEIKFFKELLERIGVLQGVNQPYLVPVAQELRGDAQAFF